MADSTQGNSRYPTTRDGRRLHAAQLDGPPGSPIVVFEAGAGGTRSGWALVQPAVAGFATAVAYDRSGLGRSAPDTVDRTFERMADDLNDLLDGLAAGDPDRRFVLVGHSLGGPIVRLAAARRPERIRGLVLVDPSDEGIGAMLRPMFPYADSVMFVVLRVLARTGVSRLLTSRLAGDVPADVKADLAREATTPVAIDTMQQELTTFRSELPAWQDSPPSLGDIPVTVISGVKTDRAPKIRAASTAAHARRAAASPHGRHVLAENSGHNVPLTDPDLVVAEICRLVAGPGADAR
ncbi:alpha/beta fold hydrolase [Tsukamurella pseudospumae]|uniref:AB hydrolase-1 domain-containing protein n=1 Tax=Tsukamurella pseudospumae TaxID=239498 RepID=A0A138AWR4_9ACTN|nr:alpha/beta hydrolase [Tsukamurella pseudospumae]KXP01434.1 hypothetical protein AXK61_01060 [Tsukamurella pseudospumae]KXP14898.1 hypothetical protein AXK60_03240 [Tsukamurella pseudospumae]